MTLEQLFIGGGGLLLIALSIVQISPIKINPWSKIAKLFGKAINGDLILLVEHLSTEVKELRTDLDEREADAARTRIIRFGDEILSGVNHSKEHYDKILLDITAYDQYCTDHPKFPNNVAKATIKNIEESYQKHWEERTFL